MKHLSRHPFYLLLAMFSFFSCFKKKVTYPKNVEQWIEANFPGQLVVVNSNWNYDINDLIITGKKIAVVADKAAFYRATQPIRDKYGVKYATLLKRIEDTR